MKIEKGTLLKSRTRTMGDVFGEVLWEVVETGLDARDKDRSGATDGVRCIMLGGTGPSARPGYVVHDTEWQIGLDLAAGKTTAFPAEQKEELLKAYATKK